MAEIQRHVFVTGRVQGVGFRFSTAEEAGRYPGLKGFVRNLEDGRVEAVFSGQEKDVLAMVAWCKHGPPSAKVTQLQVIEEPVVQGLQPFSVEKG
jgi:acylphosphatase